MKRVIRDYDSLDPDLLSLLEEAYPNGVRKTDLIAFPASGGKWLHGVELRTADTLYIIKGDFERRERSFGFALEAGAEQELGEGGDEWE